MKTRISSKKNGAALVAVMVILVAVTLMVAALLQLGSFGQIETVQQVRSAQAHWLAEAGLERGLSRVMASKNYRTALPNSFYSDEILLGGLGSYYVEINRAPNPINSVLTDYTITSTGTVSNNALSATGVVRLSITTAPGVTQAFMALGGSSRIKNASSMQITGDIYIAGDGTVGKNAQIDGTVQDADDLYTILYDSAVDVELIDFPPVDRNPYQTLINTAVTGAYPSNYTGSVTFSGSTNYYKGDLTISGVSGSGGGAVVATGNITVNNNTALPQQTKLVAGKNILFATQASTAGNNILFSFGDITFNANTQINGIGNTFMALGGISLSANADPFAGILYAEGTYSGSTYSVVIANGVQNNMSGTVIAWHGFDLGSNLEFIYDPSVFASPSPIDFGNNLVIMPGTWQWEEAPFD